MKSRRKSKACANAVIRSLRDRLDEMMGGKVDRLFLDSLRLKRENRPIATVPYPVACKYCGKEQ